MTWGWLPCFLFHLMIDYHLLTWLNITESKAVSTAKKIDGRCMRRKVLNSPGMSWAEHVSLSLFETASVLCFPVFRPQYLLRLGGGGGFLVE